MILIRHISPPDTVSVWNETTSKEKWNCITLNNVCLIEFMFWPVKRFEISMRNNELPYFYFHSAIEVVAWATFIWHISHRIIRYRNLKSPSSVENTTHTHIHTNRDDVYANFAHKSDRCWYFLQHHFSFWIRLSLCSFLMSHQTIDINYVMMTLTFFFSLIFMSTYMNDVILWQ